MKYTLEDVYLTLCGELNKEACVPGVENAFSSGALCEVQYRNLRRAYDRILLRLGKRDEDADVEEIIGCMLAVQQELCFRMFRLGEGFATLHQANNGLRKDGEKSP